MTSMFGRSARFGLVFVLSSASIVSAQVVPDIPVTAYEISPPGAGDVPAAFPNDGSDGSKPSRQSVPVAMLDDSQLADVRGGFASADGAMFSFAVQMTTSVNGQVALATTLKLDAQGVTETQTAGAHAESLSQARNFGLSLAGLPQSGVVVPGPGGATAIIQNTSGQIMNVLVNDANGQAIVQNTSLTLIVPNLPALKQEAQINTVGATVTNVINSAMMQLGGH